MPAKVFISCGQHSVAERQVAQDVGAWFQSEGYAPYVAIQVQSILDLNSGIIGELKTSDYYIFINFRRDQVTTTGGTKFSRGSVYTNQELGIAYALGFEHMLLLNQQGTQKEGVFQFIVTNIPEFVDFPDILPLVQDAVQKAGWHPSYTRQLRADNLVLSPPVQYTDHSGKRIIRVLCVDIRNERPDLGAVGCVARLARVGTFGQAPQPSPDRSLLKVDGLPAYGQTIWPKSHGAFDLLGVDQQHPSEVYLLSALDLPRRAPIITTPGDYQLEYEVFSQGFPPLEVRVRLTLTGDINTTTAVIF
jgi:hypothetical protein